ncbi:type 4a pilus biogenesis protein PilO [Fastidiosibacter lacustris]|uniref:type 4a pilus biogenesis protein PilO n=1 Tax=Fastidiosibacter lacustris TaxID=2056695 RepID=UPI000E34D1A0|nr:type 4a pilus biogenesis protein PilO [Fastidiosibacter lacustris]
MKKLIIVVLDSLSVQPFWIKLILNLITLLFVIGLGYVTVVSMRYQQRENAFALESQYKEQLVKSISRSKALPILAQQVETLQEIFNYSLDALPTDSELPQLIEQLSDLAFQNGLRVKLLNPQPLEYKENYAILDIDLSCDGTFEQLSNFVNKLETLPRIILIENYRIVPYTSVSEYGILQMSMSLQTFSLKLKPNMGENQ